MVEITGRYLGDLSVQATHGPSGATVTMDAPVDHDGLGRSFSPTDLVATALGACIVTVIAIVARRRNVEIGQPTFKVTKEMVADPTRRIGRLVTTVTLPASIADAERSILERAAHTCPVHKSLGENVQSPIEFIYV